jgi:hypothetical protein
VDDPLKKAKQKAAATYDAAADHFDDEPLNFWDRIGNHTVTNLKLQAGELTHELHHGRVSACHSLLGWTHMRRRSRFS